MTIARVASGNATGNSTSGSITLSGSISSGNTVIMVAYVSNQDAVSDPAGWTRLDRVLLSASAQMVVWRASSVAGSSTFAPAWTNLNKYILEYIAFSGAVTGSVSDHAGFSETVAGTTHKCPNTTVATAGSVAVEVVVDRGGPGSTGWTAPGNITKQQDATNGGGGSGTLAMGDSIGNTVSTGTRTGGTWTSASAFSTATAGTATVILAPAGGGNVPPTANAGPDQASIAAGATVTLDGSGSADSDGTITAYTWRQISGPAVTLSSTSTVGPTFTAPSQTANSTLVFGLIVTDNGGANSTEDTVQIGVLGTGSGLIGYRESSVFNGTFATDTTGATIPASALTGDVIFMFLDLDNQDGLSGLAGWTQVWLVNVGTVAQTGCWKKTAGGADGGAAVTVAWTNTDKFIVEFVVLKNASATLGDSQTRAETTAGTTHSTPTLTPAVAGGIVLEHAMDRAGPGSTSLTPDAGESILLDATSNPVFFNHTGAAAVSGGTAGTSTPVPLGARVNRKWTGTVSTVNAFVGAIAVSPSGGANLQPVANAGPDQAGVEPYTSVQLNGTGSSDPDGPSVSYLWTQLSGPSAGLLPNPSVSSPSFLAPASLGGALLVYQLVVRDNLALASNPDTVQIGVLTATEFAAVSAAWAPYQTKMAGVQAPSVWT